VKPLQLGAVAARAWSNVAAVLFLHPPGSDPGSRSAIATAAPRPDCLRSAGSCLPQTFVECMGSTLVYVGVADRKTFDEIGAPCEDAGENENGHVLVKQVGNHGDNEVTVIFRPWIKARTLAALIADRQAESGRAQS